MKGVIFDNDGVLVNSEETAVLHDPPFLLQFGIQYSSAEYAAIMSGKTGADFLKKLNADCIARTGLPLPSEFSDKLKQNYRHQVANLLRDIEGSGDLVRSLKAMGIPVAVASNGEHETMRRKLEKVGLYETFLPHVYNKDDVGGIPKPAPDLFLFAMRKLGISNPAECIVLEDSPTGIQAAKAAGMYTIGFSGGLHRQPDYTAVLKASGADVVVDTMKEAGKIIHAFFAPPRPAFNTNQP